MAKGKNVFKKQIANTLLLSSTDFDEIKKDIMALYIGTNIS